MRQDIEYTPNLIDTLSVTPFESPMELYQALKDLYEDEELFKKSIKVPLRHAKINTECVGIEPVEEITKIYGIDVLKTEFMEKDKE